MMGYKSQTMAAIRKEVKEVFNFTCQTCQTDYSNNPKGLTVHHIVHKSKGGHFAPNNLVPLCVKCHRKLHSELEDVIISGVNPAIYPELFQNATN